jgi:hypothetical protein
MSASVFCMETATEGAGNRHGRSQETATEGARKPPRKEPETATEGADTEVASMVLAVASSHASISGTSCSRP